MKKKWVVRILITIVILAATVPSNVILLTGGRDQNHNAEILESFYDYYRDLDIVVTGIAHPVAWAVASWETPDVNGVSLGIEFDEDIDDMWTLLRSTPNEPPED